MDLANGRQHGRVDDTDRRIIARLQENGRQANTDIAAQLGLSESTVRKRIDRMQAEGTIKVVAVADPLRTGHPVIAIIGLQVAPARLAAVGDALASLREFRFIGMTVGTFDIVTEAWFESLDDLQTFLVERLAPVEGITRMETTTVVKMVRYAYDWGVDLAPDPTLTGGMARDRPHTQRR
jgi:Lrp/AsnC family transcriptional regulator for asnA, asnC and gidA